MSGCKLVFNDHITGKRLTGQATVGPVPRVGEFISIKLTDSVLESYSCLKVEAVYYIYNKGWLDFVELECRSVAR